MLSNAMGPCHALCTLWSNGSSLPQAPTLFYRRRYFEPHDHHHQSIKALLSITLTHFLPLSGRLATEKQDNPRPSLSVFIDCSNSDQGAEFIHAVADNVTVADILSPIDIPPIVKSFFALTRAVNYDGHTMPLLAVQITELVDGFFVGLSINHVVADGSSFWHFYNTWAEICRKLITTKKENIECNNILRPPITKRWFLDQHQEGRHTTMINLPFSHQDEFIQRHYPPPLRERVFHFSNQSLARLKAKANEACCSTNNEISKFQALSALIWRSVTRANCVPIDQETTCKLIIDDRLRLKPPLSRDYFGNSIQAVSTSTKVGELLSHDLGWAASLLHQAVVNHTDHNVRKWLMAWLKNPTFYQIQWNFDQCIATMGSSPRFDVYGCDFGWGKAVAVRSGPADKYSGKVWMYPGREGGGSIDVEVGLSPVSMSVLESDEEFMGALYSPLYSPL